MFKRHLYTGVDNSEDCGVLNIRITGQEKRDVKDVDMSDLQKEHFSVSVDIIIYFQFFIFQPPFLECNEIISS